MTDRRKDSGWKPGPMFCKFEGPVGDYAFQKKPFKKRMEAHRRHPHKKQKDKTEAGKCPCAAFRLCDAKWLNMDWPTHRWWNHSVKKPAMSGYSLWMKECLCTMNQFGTFPAGPTESGGFSCRYVTESPDRPDEPVGAAPPPPPCFECIPAPSPGRPCPDCSTTTPDELCITLQGLGTNEFDPNRTYHIPQVGSCYWQDVFPHIGTLYANVQAFGHEHTLFYCHADTGHGPQFVWQLQAEGQPADCWQTRILTCTLCPQPPPHPCWDSFAVWHTSQWCPGPLDGL